MAELINLFKWLPIDILNNILEFTNAVRYRTGKYINRITDIDEKYKIIKNIPRPLKINPSTYSINLKAKNRHVIKTSLTYVFTLKNNKEFILLYITDYHIGSNGMQYTKKNYLFDINSNWSKIVDYTM